MSPDNPTDSIHRDDQKQQKVIDAFREEAIWKELRTIYDPEIPVNIVDLGLIYSARTSEGEKGHRIDVRMSLTAPGCSMSEVIKAQVEHKLSQLSGVSEVHVEVVFDPPWNPGMMSEAAKLQLGFDSDFGAPASSSSNFNIIR
jgi:metal-sulfur cluster biosynthetic enzyme